MVILALIQIFENFEMTLDLLASCNAVEYVPFLALFMKLCFNIQ